MESGKVIVFYDGTCPLCIGWVKFLLDRDGHDRFHFAPIQGDWARQFFTDHNLPGPDMDSILVWEEPNLSRESDAIAVIASNLPGIWRIGQHFRVIPVNWRNCAYRWIARNRTRWFGKRQQCWVPQGNERNKFADRTSPF